MRPTTSSTFAPSCLCGVGEPLPVPESGSARRFGFGTQRMNEFQGSSRAHDIRRLRTGRRSGCTGSAGQENGRRKEGPMTLALPSHTIMPPQCIRTPSPHAPARGAPRAPQRHMPIVFGTPKLSAYHEDEQDLLEECRVGKKRIGKPQGSRALWSEASLGGRWVSRIHGSSNHKLDARFRAISSEARHTQ
ncbi:hypothetical protein C8R45DRAFT_936623 [Mycena sanguinolenta]|nr:hypothetical protein C8R45DRAFT_936623 [Mycena sanguinolenta]